MLLAYLDESSSATRYYIGALMVDESAALPLIEALDKIMNDTAAAYPQLDPGTELHAHELVNSKGKWGPMKNLLRVRIKVFELVLRAIVQHGAHLIVEGIDVTRLHERYASPDNPHTLALMFITERENEYAQACDQRALMIADEVDHRDEHRRNLWVAQRSGTWGYRAQKIDRVVDTLHFAPSHTSRLLQAADVATFLYRRRATHTEADPPAEREWARLYEILRPAIARARCWP